MTFDTDLLSDCCNVLKNFSSRKIKLLRISPKIVSKMKPSTKMTLRGIIGIIFYSFVNDIYCITIINTITKSIIVSIISQGIVVFLVSNGQVDSKLLYVCMLPVSLVPCTT